MAPPLSLLAGVALLYLMIQRCAAAPSSVTVAVQYQLLSLNSGRFVASTGSGDLHAMGTIDNPRTLFYPHHNIRTGTIAFQSVCYPGWYIIFQNETELKLGTPRDRNELFEENLVFSGHTYKSYVHHSPQCYLAFDHYGNVHDDSLCKLTAEDVDIRIYPMIAMTSSAECHRGRVEL